MKFKDFFVIGTDTDVGKTYVSTLLYKALKKHNFQYYKPIQSGCFSKDGKLTAPDVDFLTKFIGVDYDDSMVTYTLKEEVSPHLASEMEGTTIEIENVKKHFEDLKKKYSNILVEGAGGLYVPLIRDKFYIYDLIKLFNLSVVLVCGTKVGSINHTMLTLNALNTMGIKLHGLVFNNYKGQFFEDDNIKVILELSKIENYLIIKNGQKEISNEEIEKFYVLYLSSSNEVIEFEENSVGTLDRSSVYPREIYKKIINLNAKSVILAHNHPSDNITPSKCDIELTNEIAKGLKNFGALLIEHIIITKNSYFSFLEEGLI